MRWKPHPKSAALGHLTQLVCRMPKVMSDIVKGIDLDLAAGPGYTFENNGGIAPRVRCERGGVRATLTAARDADFDGTWNVRSGADIYDTAGRKDALRNTINHFVHHRGQLTVFLRLLDVPIPQCCTGQQRTRSKASFN